MKYTEDEMISFGQYCACLMPTHKQGHLTDSEVTLDMLLPRDIDKNDLKDWKMEESRRGFKIS